MVHVRAQTKGTEMHPRQDTSHEWRVQPKPSANVLAAAILSTLVAEHPAQLSFNEIVRYFSGPSDGAIADDVSDVLADLTGDGLVHHHAEFYFATRAAVQAESLRP